MTYIEQYDIHPTTTFKEEVKEIYRYLAITLKEPSIANNLYKKILGQIFILHIFHSSQNYFNQL